MLAVNKGGNTPGNAESKPKRAGKKPAAGHGPVRFNG